MDNWSLLVICVCLSNPLSTFPVNPDDDDHDDDGADDHSAEVPTLLEYQQERSAEVRMVSLVVSFWWYLIYEEGSLDEFPWTTFNNQPAGQLDIGLLN